MPRTIVSLVVVLFVCAAAPAVAATTTVAILQLNGNAADQALRDSLVDSLAAELGRQPGFKVVTRSEINAVLGLERLKDGLGCSDMACMAEIGGALGVDRLVGGTLVHQATATGEFFSLTTQLIDARRGEALARKSVTWEGRPEGLFQLLPSVVLELVLGPAAAALTGQLVITSTVAGAIVQVNGKEIGRTPIVSRTEVPIGKVTVDVIADDYEPFRAVTIVDRDRTSGVVVDLKERPHPPVYARWWFWTAAVAVVGGGTAAALLATRGSGSGTKSPSTSSGQIDVPKVPGY